MKNTITLTSFSISVFLLFFCGIIRHDVNEQSYLKLAAEKQFNAVGTVYIDTNKKGSCILINEKYILSAAHVFIENDIREDTIREEGRTIVVYQPYNHRVVNSENITVNVNGEFHKVKKIILHPYYRDSATKGNCDLVLLELATPIKNIQPASLNWDTDELHTHVVGVGYGASGTADKPETVAFFDKKIAGQNVIDSIDGFLYQGKPTLMFCDFDHPTRTDCNIMGSSTPEPLEYICSGGDSGGGLFRKMNDKWTLIGVCTGGSSDIERLFKTGYYGQTMSWTRVSVFKQWFLENMK